MRPIRPVPLTRQRGAAALLVVIVLFFILAMVTAYAGRNLIFEQRTSINNQRAVQALEAAEAGIDYAISRLGGGWIDGNCVPTAVAAAGVNTFRERYLNLDPGNGRFQVSGALANLRPTCMLLANGPDCSCPSVGNAPNLIDPVGLAPTFQLRFETDIVQAGLVRVRSLGCSSIGKQCYAARANDADAVAEVSVLLGLSSALATPPTAPLIVRGSLDANGGALGVVNTDTDPTARGITIDAGGAVTNAGNLRLTSPPGSPSSASILSPDSPLANLTAEQLFISLFGMDRATYRTQPAAIRITCAGNCSTAIANTAATNPGRVIWAQGPVSLDSDVVLGSAAVPLVLVVQGDLSVAANVTMHGVLYLHNPTVAPGHTIQWSTAGGTTSIQGAVIAEHNLSVIGAPTVVFNPDVLRTINLTQGSMVRVPGSWRDFQAGS